MYNTFEEVKALGKELTGLEVVKNNAICGKFNWTGTQADMRNSFIEIGTIEPFRLYDEGGYLLLLNPKIPRQFLLLYILLHEIAHYKQALRFKDSNEANFSYCNNPNYFEKVANRYASMYYRRFIK